MLFCLSVAYWDFVDFNIITAETYDRALIWSNLDSLGPVLPSAFMLHFAILFTERTGVFWKKNLIRIVYILAVLMILIDIPTHLITGTLSATATGWELVWNYHSPDIVVNVFNGFYTFATYFASFFLFIVYYRKGIDPIKKKQLQLILIGFILSSISYILDGIGMFTSISIPPIPLFGLTFLLGFIGIAMVRYEMFSINPISAADTIINTMSDMLFLLDKGGRIVSLNPYAEQKLGCKEQTFIGKDMDQLITKNNDNHIFSSKLLRVITNSGEINDIELDATCDNKKIIPLSLSCSAITTRKGVIRGIVCIGRDISERKKAEGTLRQHAQDLERLNKSLVGREIKMIELKKEIERLQHDIS